MLMKASEEAQAQAPRAAEARSSSVTLSAVLAAIAVAIAVAVAMVIRKRRQAVPFATPVGIRRVFRKCEEDVESALHVTPAALSV